MGGLVDVVVDSGEERGCLADRSLEEGSDLDFSAVADVAKDSEDERGGLTCLGGGSRLADFSLTRGGGLDGVSRRWG